MSASAGDFVARAALARALGDDASALADLRTALERDPADVAANLAVLRLADASERAAAASRLIAGDCRDVQALREAIRVKLAEPGEVARGLRASGAGVAGWVAWAGPGTLTLEVEGAQSGGTIDVAPNPAHALAGDGYCVADVEIPELVEVSHSRDRKLSFRRIEPRPLDDGPIPRPPRGPALTVIVPIHDGLEATRACLESLFSQQDIVFSTILVDDAAPDPALSELADAAARRIGVTLLRNARNLGFAGSVNRALALRDGGDVVLLNADTLLPSTALARLRSVAAGDPSLGTATPFSNNGQLAGFPRPFVVHRLPSAAEVEAIDDIAWAAHGGAVVDVPTGIGFCLYIRGACLDAVGVLPERYGRGYYEDVEFCMIARQRGFRNVCATGIFVGHAGSVSFKSEKPALASRNLAILEQRFPRQEREFLAFAQADPLRWARAAIEERLPPRDACALVVASGARSHWQARQRARDLEARGAAAIVLSFQSAGRRVEPRRAEPGGPASLSFVLDEAGEARLVAYLRKLSVVAVEILDAADTPDALIDVLIGLGAPIDAFCVDPSAMRRAPGPKEPERLARLARVTGAARRVRSLDRMGAALASRVFGARAEELEAEVDSEPLLVDPAFPPVLGVLAPVASVACDRVLARLSRKLACRDDGVAIVVFGDCFNERDLLAAGSAVVVGCSDPEEWPGLARLFGVGALAAFDRDGLFGPLDRLARQIGARKAYFDWSFGELEAAPGDLAMDPGVCDETAAAAVATWLNSD